MHIAMRDVQRLDLLRKLRSMTPWWMKQQKWRKQRRNTSRTCFVTTLRRKSEKSC